MNEFTAQHAPVIGVTLVYISLYYAFMANILRVKLGVIKRCKEAGEPFCRYTNQYPELLAADRTQLNMLEHMPPFLVLMWLHSFIVSPTSAAILGSIYVLLRATYPFFLGARLHRNFPLRLLFNTFSAYGVLVIMAVWQVMVLFKQ